MFQGGRWGGGASHTGVWWQRCCCPPVPWSVANHRSLCSRTAAAAFGTTAANASDDHQLSQLTVAAVESGSGSSHSWCSRPSGERQRYCQHCRRATDGEPETTHRSFKVTADPPLKEIAVLV